MLNPFRLPFPELLLRLAVAVSFSYPPLVALGDPYTWLGYVPTYVLTLLGGQELLFLHAFGVVELAVALWVVFARNAFAPALLAAVLLLLIVITNLAQFPILFRDVSIALAALALAWTHRPGHTPHHGTE